MKLLLFFLLLSHISLAQFTKADSIRGGYGETRNWWDLTHYDLSVTFNEQSQTIQGQNIISYTIVGNSKKKILQIDLQEPLILDSICFEGTKVNATSITKIGNAYFFDTDLLKMKNEQSSYFTVYYHGKPRQAKNPPWDGGVIWKKDANGLPWITIACQGLGASVWFPCKDSQYDEPDSVAMHYTCSNKVKCVSNGRLIGVEQINAQQSTYSWKVVNPINNYCMIPYIGDYVTFHEDYEGEKGHLDLDYWVKNGNLEKAKKQFKDVAKTMKAFEYWFGPYPFYEDGYKLIEAPHLGMEHQSAVAYGNGFRNGYMGTDLSGTGEGLKWDYIIVHETGHEWFGNSITTKDIADMWVHEAFTDYSETLFLDYWFGTPSGNRYCIGLRKNIANDEPIIGQYDVQKEGSGDMYYKGANLIHTIRTLYGNDTLFRTMLRKMNQTFYHQTVTTQQIEQFMSNELKMDLSKIFDQYLRTNKPPVLEIVVKGSKFNYRWTKCVAGFNMDVIFNDKKYPCTEKWSTIKTKEKLVFNRNLYVFRTKE